MSARCILCNDENGACLVLADCESFHCRECGGDFDIDELDERVKELRKMACVAKAAKAAADKE